MAVDEGNKASAAAKTLPAKAPGTLAGGHWRGIGRAAKVTEQRTGYFR